MLEESGRVVALDGELALIAIERQAGCQSCSARQGCGHDLFGGADDKMAALSVTNRLGAHVGDRVVVGVGESALLRAAVLMYLWPLLVFFLAAGVVSRLGGADSVVALAGLVALGFAFLSVWAFQRRCRQVEALRPLMLRVVGS